MADLIPRQVLFGNPERAMPRLSPDGTRLAWIAPRDGVLNVWLAPVSAETGVDLDQAAVITDDKDRGIRTYQWAHDNRHLLYLQDTGGDENWRLYDVDIQTMQRRDLTPFDGVQTQIVATERDFPTELLIGLNKDNPELHDVYRLDLTTGGLTKEVDNPGFAAWLADSKLVVRCAFAPLPDGGFQVLVRDGTTNHGASDEWRLLKEIPAEAQAAFGANGINPAASPTTAHTRHTRARAATGSMPRFAQRNESQPPAKPPIMAAKGGSHASHAASTNVRWFTSTRYSVVQLLHSEYETILSAFAAINPHIRRSRRISRLCDNRTTAEGCAGAVLRAITFHNGIQASPAIPVATNAIRHW